MTIKTYIQERLRQGFCFFTSSEAALMLKKSPIALRSAIKRLKRKGELAEPVKGFLLIIPPQYLRLGCLPADHFIHDLMEYLKYPYYVSLLSGAQYYGAAHQKSQVFQVIIEQKHRPIVCGQVKIRFITRKNIQHLPVKLFNTPQGVIRVAFPELVAMDLVTYISHGAGINNVLTVLAELAEHITPEQLQILAAESKDTPWMQRLGYLLEQLGQEALCEVLLKELNCRNFRQRLLLLNANCLEANTDPKWKLTINTELELDYDS